MATLGRNELVAKLCENVENLSQAKAKTIVNLVFNSIIDATANGEGASFPGFGSFSVLETAPRVGRNPSTGEPIQIAAGKRIKFSAGSEFKKALQ